MKISKMKKEDLELLSNKDITKLVLEESKKPMNTADLFKKIIELLELPESSFENKIGDYYTSLSTDKRFLLIEDGCWDLKSNHTSDKVKKNIDSIDEEYDEEEDELPEEDDILNEEIEDDYSDDDTTYEDTTEDLKDLVVLDEDELELDE